MSEHSNPRMPNARLQGSAHIDARPEGNLLKLTLRRITEENPNAPDDDLLALWCLAAKRDREFNAQIMDYAFTNTLKAVRGQFRSTDELPTLAQKQRPLVRPSVGLRQRQDAVSRAQRDTRRLLFEIFIDGKLLRDCTIAEVRAHAVKAPVQAAFFNKIVLDTKGKNGATLIGDHYVDAKKLNKLYAEAEHV